MTKMCNSSNVMESILQLEGNYLCLGAEPEYTTVCPVCSKLIPENLSGEDKRSSIFCFGWRTYEEIIWS